ncbi:hypothetical protein [Streptomyces cyaneofuscatus]|uniref:hypothetical protein n=1 Tax=Streptomyces cyaneofuscatus TaxID=66883 RepID=UPI0036DB6CBB
MAPRFRRLSRLIDETERWSSFAQAARDGKPIRWALRHPIHALRNPVVTLFAAGSEELEGSCQRMNATATSIRESVARRQITNAIQGAMERDLYRPGYLEDRPYVRLLLRGAKIWLSTLSGGDERSSTDNREARWVEVTALVHKSGVVQFTFSLNFPNDISASDFTRMQYGSSAMISSVELPEALLKHAPSWRWLAEGLPGEWRVEREGTRWRRCFLPEKMSLSDLFDIYLEAFVNTAKVPISPDWMCHPCSFVERISCCDSEIDFRGAHQDEMKYMITRYLPRGGDRSDRQSSISPPDTSLSMDHSVYMGGDKGLVINWPGFGAPTGYASHLNHTVVAESALLQWWQIRTINWRIANTTTSLRAIEAVQEAAIFGLREYRDPPLSYGTANDVAQSLLREWRADALYGYTIESLEQLQQLASTAESQRAAKRANGLAASAIAATVILGMPAIEETLAAIRKVPGSGFVGSTVAPMKRLAEGGQSAVWVCYIMLICGVAVISLLRTRKQAWRKVKNPRNKRVGIRWPYGSVEITVVDSDGNPRRR